MRVDLPDGQWAELRERINHGADKRIKLAQRLGKSDDAAALEVDDVLIREYVVAWRVLDIEGNAIELGNTETLPEEVADAIAIAAAMKYIGAPVPNAPSPD